MNAGFFILHIFYIVGKLARANTKQKRNATVPKENTTLPRVLVHSALARMYAMKANIAAARIPMQVPIITIPVVSVTFMILVNILPNSVTCK